MMEYRVRLYLHEAQNLYHLSGVITGLSDLAARGIVDLELHRPRDAESVLVGDPLTLCMEVEACAKRRRLAICIDLHDRSDRICRRQLEASDLYFKRSFYAPHIGEQSLAPVHRDRVVPFGLNYACRSRVGTRRTYQALAAAYLIRHLPALLSRPRCVRHLLRDELAPLRQFQTSPSVEEFEQPPGAPLQPTILFQTRVWSPEETEPDDHREINHGRVSVIRALRNAFGPQFQGGLVPNEFARQNYPDLITSQVHRRSLYVQMSKQSLIGVYTRGLHHSLAFKLPEFLAASKCIVSDWQRNTLPTPLVENTNLLVFSTPEECVEQCARLLADGSLARRMREANFSYYEAEVRPAAHMRRCLERAFDSRVECSADHLPIAAALH